MAGIINRAFSLRSSNRSSGASSTSAGGSNTTGLASSHTAPTTTTSSGPLSNAPPTTAGVGRSRSHRRPFSFASLRPSRLPHPHHQPELSRRLGKLVKTGGGLVSTHETAARQRTATAAQLSEWGEHTADAAVSDVADKVGVVLAEVGEQEGAYARALDAAREQLKIVRNTERSVQPSRDGKARLADDIARLKAREPQSTRLVVLEQELVRAEAENMVAEAQLTNVTRQKLKEAYRAEFLATIERSDKQTILARHGLRLLELLDDTPMVPGDTRAPYAHGAQARQILNDAEDDLRDWRPDEDGSTAFVSRREVVVNGDGDDDGHGHGHVGGEDGEYAGHNKMAGARGAGAGGGGEGGMGIEEDDKVVSVVGGGGKATSGGGQQQQQHQQQPRMVSALDTPER